MNWNNIKEKYPKAWNKLIEFHNQKRDDNIMWIDHPDTWIMSGLHINGWELRHLYDFFDENDIYISAYKEDIGSDEWEFAYDIQYLPKEYENAKRRCSHFETILSFKVHGATYIGAWRNRDEAEEAAFTKAFEILEEKG